MLRQFGQRLAKAQVVPGRADRVGNGEIDQRALVARLMSAQVGGLPGIVQGIDPGAAATRDCNRPIFSAWA
ncbi:hypothetical protein Q427_06515 [Halomonas sp. BC04]|nr:hypothetical protein Q427_06515 [Halomonas sp. BC04]